MRTKAVVQDLHAKTAPTGEPKGTLWQKRLPPPPTRASEPANLVADPGREACIYVSLICDKVMAAPIITEKTRRPKFAPGGAMAKQSTVAT